MPAWVEYVNTGAGLVGLVVTAVTLWRVQAVRRAQREERALVRGLYGTDSLATQLRTAAAYLGRSRDSRARELAQDLVRVCGQIEGVSRALDGRTPTAEARRTVIEVRDRDYLTQQFVLDAVDGAANAVDILIYRPLIVSTNTVLSALRAAAERGVRIRILTLSPEASAEVLTYATRLLSASGVQTAEQLRPQLHDAERRIAHYLATAWSAPARRSISHRHYTLPPGPHLLRADATVRVGFIGLLSGPVPVRVDERPYTTVPLHSPLGEHLMTHFDQVWAQAAPVPPE